MRKTKRKARTKGAKGYLGLSNAGWAYGTEQEQKWLIAELGRGGAPVLQGDQPKLGLNRYVALRAIQVFCAMNPADRNPIGLYRRMEVAMAMLLPGYYVMVRWLKEGVKVEGRPELDGNWYKLAAMADHGEYDPNAGGFGKTVLDLMRSDLVKEKLMEVTENLLGDEEFLKQLKAEPKTLLELWDRAIAFEKQEQAGKKSKELDPETFKQTLKDLLNKDPASVGQLIGKVGRKKLKKAFELWDDE